MKNNKAVLGSYEGFAVVTVCIITKMFCGFLPNAVYRFGPPAWYIIFFSAIIAAFVLLLSIPPKGDIINDIKNTFGGFFGKIICIVIYLYFILYFAMNLREIVRVIKIYNFPFTPSVLFAAAFLLCAAFLCFSGEFSVAKLSGFYLKLIIGAFIIIFILGLGQYNFENLAPVGGYGLKSIFEGSITQLTLFTDILLLMVFVPKPGGRKKVKRTGLTAILVSALLVALSFVSYICVFDYTVAGNKTSGLIEVVKNVYYGHLFQRMESLFFLMMVVSAAISVCVWLFGSVQIYSGVFGIEDKSGIILPTAVIVLCLSSMKLDTVFHITGSYGGLFIFGILVLYRIIKYLKGVRKQ